MFDFDIVKDRRGWSSTKWLRYDSNVIPLWIADMDFGVAPPIQVALAKHVAHANFGYTKPPAELANQLVKAHADLYAWKIEPEWIVWLPGLVLGINLSIKTCCAPGERALSFSPVYPPFLSAPAEQGRGLVEVPLKELNAAGTAFAIDFDALDASLIAANEGPGGQPVRLLMLCHPHNPIGRAFTRDEMSRLAELCERYDLYVCSDEVHCDLILDGKTPHVPFGLVAQERAKGLAERVITLHGLGKTYNIAGLGLAWAVISDPALRQRFCASMQKLVPDATCMAYTAAQAAITESEPWRQELLATLRANRDMVDSALERMGMARTYPEASYLTWIDARHIAARVGNASEWFSKHGVGISDGTEFGRPGYLRLNFATSSQLLGEALERMESALAQLK